MMYAARPKGTCSSRNPPGPLWPRFEKSAKDSIPSEIASEALTAADVPIRTPQACRCHRARPATGRFGESILNDLLHLSLCTDASFEGFEHRPRFIGHPCTLVLGDARFCRRPVGGLDGFDEHAARESLCLLACGARGDLQMESRLLVEFDGQRNLGHGVSLPQKELSNQSPLDCIYSVCPSSRLISVPVM